MHIWHRFLKRRRTAICEDTSLAIPVEDQLWPWAQRLAFVNCVLDVCSSFLGELLNAQRQACQGGQCEVLKLHPVRSVLDPIRGQHCFLLYAQLGKIQEVSDQRILPILLRSSWNRFCLVYAVPNDCSDLTFPWEPRAHARPVRTQVVVRDRQNYEKSTWLALLAGGSIGSGTSSEGIVPFTTSKSFLIPVPK